MKNIPVLQVDENIEKATNNLAESMSDKINLINVKPPTNGNDGMDAASSFLESVHFLEIKNRILRSNKNNSPTCGLEMWYDNNKVKFIFYTPSDSIENEYRQQLNGYYDECEIAAQTPNEGMFIKTDSDKNESVAVCDLYLNDHYFNPLSSPVSEDNELDSDPYQRIINEIDTKDDTRVVIQFLYKPVTYDWTEMQHETIETYAKKMQDKGGFKTRWFGFKIDDVDDPGIWESASSEMKSRVNKPAYYVNVRLAMVTRAKTQQMADRRAETRIKSLVNSISHLYSTRADQELVPRDYGTNSDRNARETLLNMIKRDPTNMYQERRLHQMLWEKLTSNTSTIIMTAEELSGLVHLPSQDEVTSGSIDWTEQMVDGEVPPDVDEFEGPERDEIDEIEEPTLGDKEDDSEEGDEKPDSQSILFD